MAQRNVFFFLCAENVSACEKMCIFARYMPTVVPRQHGGTLPGGTVTPGGSKALSFSKTLLS